MGPYTIDAEAGAISSELAKLGIGLSTRVHVVVSVTEWLSAHSAAFFAVFGFGESAEPHQLA